MKPLYLVIVVLLFATLACNLPFTNVTPTPAEPSTPAETEPPLATDTPTIDQATQTPAGSTTSTELLPAGVAALDPSESAIKIYDLAGGLQGSIPAPDLYMSGGTGGAHIYGHLSSGVAALSAIYFNGGGSQKVNISTTNGVVPLREFAQPMGLAGQPYDPILAYSNVEIVGSDMVSHLYAGSVADIPALEPLLTITDPQGWTIRPVAVNYSGTILLGIWYIYFPWGIGGDIVFEPRQGLYYYDIANNTSTEVFSRDYSPWDFNITFPIYTLTTSYVAPLQIALSPSGPTFTVPLRNDSDRGAGDAVIAPDGNHIAWKEGSGYLMSDAPNFYATIRVADRLGSVLAEFQDAMLNDAAGFEIGYFRPVGWLDANTILIQVRGKEWDKAVMVRYDITRLTASYYAPGVYLDMVYP